jgi:parallel beta-helix repeat protein
MGRKMILVLVACALLFFSLSNVRFGGIGVKGSDGFRVHNLNTGLNYTTVQAALDANETLGGHKIRVDAGVYYEHVVVNKPVFLMGENRSTTVIDANGTGNGVVIRSSNASVSGFTVQNSGTLAFGNVGIWLENVRDCTVSDNEVKNSNYGIRLDNSGRTTFQRNTLEHNVYSFEVAGLYLSHFVNYVDSSNVVDGRPVYYWVNRHDEQVPFDAGYVAAVNCTGITVSDLTLRNDGQGVLLAFTNGSTVKNVTVTDNLDGVWMANCENCTVTGNSAIHNGRYGIEMQRSTSCRIAGNEASENGYEYLYSGWGIYVGASDDILISENKGHGNYYAIVVHTCSNCVISSNVVSNNSGMGIWPKFCEECVYVGNSACNNGFYGLEPEDSANCVISGNNASNNGEFGIWLLGCSKLSVTANYLQKNAVGVGLTESNSNQIYHNDFTNNRYQASIQNSSDNEWSTEVEGNYWSDYTGQDENHDGIGDAAYVIDEANRDQYPLAGAFSDFASSGGAHVNFVSNLSITDFEYFATNNTVRIRVSGPSDNQAYGFCRVCIPKSLSSPPFTVVIDDGLREPLYFNGSLNDNGTHSWIYVAFGLPAYDISIVPELFSPAIMAMTLMATLAPFIVCRRRRLAQARVVS